MFYDILDKKRIDFLPNLAVFKDRFYLARGTGLALQIGHRDSIDFDFFIQRDFDTTVLYNEIFDLFKGRTIIKTLDEKNSLNVVIDEEIKLSFLKYPYPLLNPLIHEDYLNIASIEDIGCMKFSALVGRAVEKDYVDLYFILQNISLQTLLLNTAEKMPDLDHNLILKSLVYFEDVAREKIMFKHDFKISLPEIQEFLECQVKIL